MELNQSFLLKTTYKSYLGKMSPFWSFLFFQALITRNLKTCLVRQSSNAIFRYFFKNQLLRCVSKSDRVQKQQDSYALQTNYELSFYTWWFRQAQPPLLGSHLRAVQLRDLLRRSPQCDIPRNALIIIFSANLREFSVKLCVIII